MFLNSIKFFFLKNKVTKKLTQARMLTCFGEVNQVGVLVEKDNLDKVRVVEQELQKCKIKPIHFHYLIYDKEYKDKQSKTLPTFGFNCIGLTGGFKSEAVKEFVARDFDIMVNYFDVDCPVLKLVSLESNAKLHTGFDFAECSLNTLAIKTAVTEAKVFSFELIRYLNILNKL